MTFDYGVAWHRWGIGAFVMFNMKLVWFEIGPFWIEVSW
jgi:hypothetical protein